MRDLFCAYMASPCLADLKLFFPDIFAALEEHLPNGSLRRTYHRELLTEILEVVRDEPGCKFRQFKFLSGGAQLGAVGCEACLRPVVRPHRPAHRKAYQPEHAEQHDHDQRPPLLVERVAAGEDVGVGGEQCLMEDLMFALGLPIPLRKLWQVKLFAAVLMPVAGRLPFSWVYPIGEQQEKWVPKYEKWYQWVTAIPGDCHYVRRHLLGRLEGKVLCVNTTTPQDVDRFREVGVSWLVTTTPVLDGRSFGTNMMEAALIAASGKGRPLTHAEPR